MSDVRSDRRYTKDHEWAKPEASSMLIGISAFAVEQLGDITLVNIDVKVGDRIERGKAFGTIESVKTLSDLLAPVSGKVTELNGALETQPELVNQDCYDAAWMIRVEPEAPAEYEALVDPAAYTELLKHAH